MAKHILSVLVENHAGVLLRVSGLFGRRGFNIDSLAVGVTDNPQISRITIVVDGDDYTVEQVMKQLNKLVDVIKVKNLSQGQCVSRGLALVKVKSTPQSRLEIIQVVNIFRAKIIDVSKEAMVVEITGDEDKVEALCDMLSTYGILEMARTGTISLERGNSAITV